MYNIQKFITRLFLASAVVILPVLGHSQGKPASPAVISQVKAGVKAAALSTSTISSDFTQEKEMSVINEKIITKGRFYFKKERNLRWEYTDPYAYLIVFSDDRISVKDENKINQFSVQSNKVFAEVNQVMLGCIRGTLLNDTRNFGAAYFETRDAWLVRLQPQSAKLKEILSEIVLYFDRRDFSVTRLEMAEPGGDRTLITFSGKKLNQPVADDLFTVH